MSALAECNADIVRARSRARDAEATIERLRQVIDDEAPAAEAVQRAVAADGGAGLSRFAAGKDGDLAEMVTHSEQAARAARVARGALPRAEQEFREANSEVERLIAPRIKRIEAVLLERADEVARQYRAAFRELCRLHDVLVGAAQGCALVAPIDIVISNVPLEVARFNLPALRGGSEFSPFFRHIANPITVNAAADEWAEIGRQLAADPQ
jgi:hypothetical protein